MEAQKLLNYGFQYYETLNLYPGGTAVAEIPVWKGSEKRLRAGFVQDFFVSVPKGQRSLLKVELESMQPLIAPVSPQQPVGVLRITYDGKPYGEFPVAASSPCRSPCRKPKSEYGTAGGKQPCWLRTTFGPEQQ